MYSDSYQLPILSSQEDNDDIQCSQQKTPKATSKQQSMTPFQKTAIQSNFAPTLTPDTNQFSHKYFNSCSPNESAYRQQDSRGKKTTSFTIGSTPTAPSSHWTQSESFCNTTTVPGWLTYKNINTPLPHLYMDENNDEFCQYPTIRGQPLSVSGMVTTQCLPPCQKRLIEKPPLLAPVIKPITGIQTPHNTTSKHSYQELAPQQTMQRGVLTPVQSQRNPKECKDEKQKEDAGELMLMMMKTTGMIEKTKEKMIDRIKSQPRSFNQRANKMIEAIEFQFGVGSATEWPFNIDRLEKQALIYLKLEDDLATDESKNRMPVLSFKKIIAACCYLQYFQAQDTIMINDVLQACQKLNVKAIKALDFIDKWAAHLKKIEQSTFGEYGYSPIDEEEDPYAIIRFTKEVKRKPCKTQVQEESFQKQFFVPYDLCRLEDILTQEEKERKAKEKIDNADSESLNAFDLQKHQEENSKILEEAIQESLGESVAQCDRMIQGGDIRAQERFVSKMLQPPTKSEKVRFDHAPSFREFQDPPTLHQFREWLVAISRAFSQFMRDSNLVDACFGHCFNPKKKLTKTDAAAIFYLSTCQDLFDLEETELNQLLKGNMIKWYKLRRRVVLEMFKSSEYNFVLAIRKIKSSPELIRQQPFTTDLAKGGDNVNQQQHQFAGDQLC